ncbi:MAG: type II secretion system protein [Phycisphaeraceae bacterium]|nr:type II secretion system protein [Phycisphaeraceae bacterium]
MKLSSTTPQTRHGFTLIELLVVIAIIAVLMGILMPALSRVRQQAKAAACKASLHQWTLIWSMFTSDNDGNFVRGLGGESQTSIERWPQTMLSLYGEKKMRTCPTATKPETEGGLNPYAAWGVFEDDGTFGSYGLNEWVCNRGSGGAGGQNSNYYKNITRVKKQNEVPTFMDCYWYDVWAHSIDQPPETDGNTSGMAGSNEMRRVCLNRHSQSINVAFMDWSIRKVDLKELWTLKWHKNYNINGPWTRAGGATAEKWPDWMKGMTEY